VCVAAIDDHGSCRGDTVRALAQWQCPVAPSEALGMLYQAMRVASHRALAYPHGHQNGRKLRAFLIIVN
jgi:hypothetical protein